MAIIKGALDLTHKTARNAMTPIDMASQALLLPRLGHVALWVLSPPALLSCLAFGHDWHVRSIGAGVHAAY